MARRLQTSSLVPYTTLFRSQVGHAERIDENDIGQRRKREYGALHGAERRLVDVDAVDLRGIGCGNRSHGEDRKSTRLNSSHVRNSYAVFCLKKKQQRLESG